MSYKNPPKSNSFRCGTSGNPFGCIPKITNKDLYHNLRILRMLIDLAMQQLRQKGNSNATES